MSSTHASPRPAQVGPPSKHQLAVMIWLAVFPTLTVLNRRAELSPPTHQVW